MNLHYEIEELFEDKTVKLEITCSVQNDSFSHAFGTETYPDYLQIDDVSYDRQKYTEQEQGIIDEWIDDNDITLYDYVDNYDFSSDYEPDFDEPEPDCEPDCDYAYHQYDKHYDY